VGDDMYTPTGSGGRRTGLIIPDILGQRLYQVVQLPDDIIPVSNHGPNRLSAMIADDGMHVPTCISYSSAILIVPSQPELKMVGGIVTHTLLEVAIPLSRA
jgi:hypothetical protein